MNQDTHWKYTIREWNEEPFCTMLDNALSQKPKVIYDIGGCVGAWSYSAYTKNVGQFFCFEPFVENFNYMLQKQELIDMKGNFTPINHGIWYGKNIANAFWRGDGNVGGMFIEDVALGGLSKGVSFDLKKLEDLELPKPDLIKIDVEGAEKNIVEHSQMLKTTKQLIIEWHYDKKDPAIPFFEKYLPHDIIMNIEDGMFLLRLKK